MKRIVFVDRDGTVIREPKSKQIDTLESLEFIPGIISGLKLLVESRFSLIMVSNQDGLGTETYPMRAFKTVQPKILKLLGGEGVHFEKVFVCPHRAIDNCGCRKPKVGLVKRYLDRVKLDKDRSFVLGDRETDVLFAQNLGLKSVRLTTTKSSRATYVTGDAFDACMFIRRSIRSAALRRRTNETDIAIRVLLDGSGEYVISTGIGFLDHMLAQLSRHSHIDLTIKARGDLEIDEHHTVEDVGLAIGACIRSALGDKRGIERFGFAAPMDEALAQVALDISGRSFLAFDCTFRRESVGGFPTELVEDFFRGFAGGLQATIHITCRGRNEHHKIEAIFKSTARALKAAVRVDHRALAVFPSTKGTL